MHLNVDCVRDVLIYLEQRPFGVHSTLNNVLEALPKYESDEIHYCCLKLYEAGFVDLVEVSIMGSYVSGIKSIHELTFQGHEFLENIKSESNWISVKQASKNIGSQSLQILSAIAIELIQKKMSNFF